MTLRWVRTPGPRIDGGSSLSRSIDPLLAAWIDQPGLDLADVDVAVVGPEVAVALALAARGAQVTVLRDADPTSGPTTTTLPRRWRRHVRQRPVDLVAPPTDLVGAFGLVVAADVVERQPPARRDAAMQGLGALVGSGGWLVAVVLLATSQKGTKVQGPPWPLAPSDLTAWRAAGLDRVELAHPPATAPPVPAQRVRTTWRRPQSDEVTGPVPG